MRSSPGADRAWLEAYLGDPAARERLGPRAPEPFAFRSLLRGGDRPWRKAMQLAGRRGGQRALTLAACEIVRLAWEEYRVAPDPSAEVDALASEAVSAIAAWKAAGGAEVFEVLANERCTEFCLAVEIGGVLARISGWRGKAMGEVVAGWANVASGSFSTRYVRDFGDLALRAREGFGLPETALEAAVVAEMMPLALALEPSEVP